MNIRVFNCKWGTLLIVNFVMFLAFFTPLSAQNFTDGYDFPLPTWDSIDQTYLPFFEKKTIDEFVSISSDGDFVVANETIKFWGVNLTTGACFPDKSDAPMIAARMRKMGINLVRFHHMDNPWTNNEGTIFNKSLNSTTSLDPVALDKLHYFIYQLKLQGIYANINLIVSRTFTENDGVLDADNLPQFAKAVSMFDGQLIQLQQDYARQLLSSVNPYSGLALSNDPVMAMLEITNENTVYGFWKDDFLHQSENGVGIPQRHSDSLDLLWNQFLVEKYQTQENLETAWGVADGLSTELLIDGDFEQGNIDAHWKLELHETAQATMSLNSTTAYHGVYSAKVVSTATTGTSWHMQFENNDNSIQKDSVYQIQFYAKSDIPVTIYSSVIRNAEPWTWYGGAQFLLTQEWQEYSYTFKAPESNDELTRISISLNENENATYEFDDFSMTTITPIGLDTNEDLALNNISRMKYSERSGYSKHRVADMAEFYIQLQKTFYDDMNLFLKSDLGVIIPITGSNALGGLYESMSMQDLDYIDDHAYWDHPRFPNQPWDSWDWLIENSSMLKHDFLGTIPSLFGGYEIKGKPYTISEYNHAFPNIYQTEMLPIICGEMGYHGCDAIMFFEYNGGSPAIWESDKISNFFSLHSNPAVMALFPTMSLALRNNMIKEDQSPIITTYTPAYIFNLPQTDDHYRWWAYYPYDYHLGLEHHIVIESFNSNNINLPSGIPVSGTSQSNTNELLFDKDRELFHIHTPQFECIDGNLANAYLLENGAMKVISGDKLGIVSWISTTEDDLEITEKSFLTIVSRPQNQNMIWDQSNTTIHNNWGNGPTEIQSLNIELSLDIIADSIIIYPLGTKGEIIDSFMVYPSNNGKFFVRLDQTTYQTPWFGIRAIFNSDAVLDKARVEEELIVSPNPISNNVLQLNPPANTRIKGITIYNTKGDEMCYRGGVFDGFRSIYDISFLSNGMYFGIAEMSSGQKYKFEFIKIE